MFRSALVCYRREFRMCVCASSDFVWPLLSKLRRGMGSSTWFRVTVSAIVCWCWCWCLCNSSEPKVSDVWLYALRPLKHMPLASMLIDNRTTMLNKKKKKECVYPNIGELWRSTKSTDNIDLLSQFSRVAAIDQNRRFSWTKKNSKTNHVGRFPEEISWNFKIVYPVLRIRFKKTKKQKDIRSVISQVQQTVFFNAASFIFLICFLCVSRNNNGPLLTWSISKFKSRTENNYQNEECNFAAYLFNVHIFFTGNDSAIGFIDRLFCCIQIASTTHRVLDWESAWTESVAHCRQPVGSVNWLWW